MLVRAARNACQRCSGAVVQAHAPEHIVPGGVVAKLGDHLPFCRQAEIQASLGIQLDRTTLGN
ncbi:hypothetical protein [Mesorhizobium sp. M1143]|uniref:hypothetical protein n=1 Tax=Mesorhizobium sp. M1143 TaxID=2957061 RepID=UPI00333702E2